MEDLLGMEVQYNKDGSIKLHQRKYIECGTAASRRGAPSEVQPRLGAERPAKCSRISARSAQRSAGRSCARAV